MVLSFPIMADYCLLSIGERTVFVTHGHLFNTDNPPALSKGDLLLHGHTHVQVCEPFGNDNVYLNPGSVSIPKESSEHGYMIIDETGCVWKTLDGRAFKRFDF